MGFLEFILWLFGILTLGIVAIAYIIYKYGNEGKEK